MGDLAQNVEAVFKKWEAKSRGRGSRHGNYNSRQNDRRFIDRGDNFSFSKHSRNSRSNYRGPRYSNPSYESLAVFKMTPSVLPQRHSRPFVGIPCTKCVPFSKGNIEDTTLYLLGIHNILSIPYISKEHFVPFNINWFWNLSRLHSIASHSSIGFLQSQRVINTIKEFVDKTKVDTDKDAIISEYHEKCQIIYNTIKATISSFCVGIVGFSLHCILKRIFDRIFFHKGQIEIIASLKQDGVPFIYLPLYRSYFDHLLVPYVLHMCSLQVPYTAVKKDLYIPFISYICRYLGVIFYEGKTSFQNEDSLYEAILKNYIVHCTENNGSSILFLEDNRSISGKSQLPNSDLLATIINSVAQGSTEDAYIVPVSVSYEKIEGNYITEQLGTKTKQPNIISRLHSLWKMIHFKYGNVRVNFSQPFSVQEFLKSCNKSNFSTSNEYCVNSKKESSVEKLAHHVIYDATSCTSLMSSHLLAFLLVTQYRNGGTQQQLQSSVDWLRSEIIGKKWDVGFTGESLPVINRAIEILGKDLVTTETIEMEWTSSDLENNNVKVKVYTPTVKLPYILELRYYANAVVPLFLKESIIVNALYAIVDVDICHFHHCDSRFYVSRDELIETAIKLVKYLKYEFIIVPPCEDIVNVFNDVIDALIQKECLSLVNMGDRYTKSRKHLSFASSSDEEDFEDLSRKQQLKVDLQEESINHLEFLRQILSPYIESYWLAACSLLQLIDEIKEESVFIQEMQMTAQDKLYKGLLAYEESFSADTFKNALKVFQDQDIIHCDCEDNVKIVYLTEQYNSLESINCVIGEIEDFRK